MSNLAELRALRGFLFDMDGVIYRGTVALPGAASFIAGLRGADIPFMFLTNNSTTAAPQVAERLAAMGIPVDPAEVVTSAEVTAAALAAETPGGCVLLVGEDGIRTALAQRGFSFTEDHRSADIVVVGMDRQLTYARLQEAALAIRRGALFVATNTDRSLPSTVGEIPGAGALVAALQTATDVEPRVIGKPEPDMYLHALPRLGVPKELTAAVGDRPETDILGGQRAGLRTIGVLSGAGTRAGFAAMQPPPDWLFRDLEELGEVYFG